MAAWFRLAASLVLLAPLVLSCTADLDAGRGRRPIIGGEIDTAHPEVVALTVFGSSEFCSGTVIAPRAVLTAAHCVAGGYEAPAILVFFGTTVGGEGQLMRVTQVTYHPDFYSDAYGYVYNDVAVITLEQDAPVKPAAWQRTPLEDISGQTVTFVGYGVTDGRTQTGSGERRTVDGVVDSLNDSPGYVHFAASGTGTCQGDSGGPTFLDRDGVPTVIAVTSIGEVGCLGSGDNTRVDIHADFITPLAPMPVEITVSEPTEGAWVGSDFTVVADATAAAGVTEVALLLDGEQLLTCAEPPCSFDLRGIGDGDHIVTVKGTGADGGTGATEVWVTVVTQEFGIGCKADADCKSGFCAEYQSGAGYCSHTCSEDADCPLYSNCVVVWSQKACSRPGSNPTGCAVSGGSSGSAAGLLFILVGVLAARGFGGRRARRWGLALLVGVLALTLAACGDNRWGDQNDAGYPPRARPDTDGGVDAPALQGIGDPCTADGEITQGSCNAGLICIIPETSAIAVNGYCTVPCGAGLGCPEGSACVYGTTHSMFCLKSCTKAADCRTEDGYHCMEKDDAQVCWGWIVPPGTNDGGPCSTPDAGPFYDDPDRLFGESQELPMPDGGTVASSPRVAAKGTTVATSFNSSGTFGTRGDVVVTASQDRGATFGAPLVLRDAVNQRRSDPLIAIDPTGAHLYAAWIGSDRSSSTHQPTNWHVFVARSDDAGLTWPTSQMYDASSTDSNTVLISQPWLATGPNGTVYVAYTLGDPATAAIKVARSSDDGATWDAPVRVDETSRTPANRGLPRVATNGAGDVFVAWGEVGSGGDPNGDALNDVFVARWNAGDTWGSFGTNVKANGNSDLVVANALAVAPSAAGTKLYVVYVAGEPTLQRWDVRMNWSNDRGNTWLASSIKINDDPTCAIHVLPTAAIDANDHLHVAWYDNRFGVDAGGFYYARWDGTMSPSEFISDVTFAYSTETRTTNRIGNYAGLAVDGTYIYAAWADARGVTNTSRIRVASGTLE